MATTELKLNRLDRARFKAGLTYGTHQAPGIIVDGAMVRADLIDKYYGGNIPAELSTLRSISEVMRNRELSEKAKRKAVAEILGLQTWR